MKSLWLIPLLSAGIADAQVLSQQFLEREIEWVNYYSRQYAVPAELVAAVIDVESAWRPDLVSPSGAAGLMQLMPATAFRFGVTNQFQIDENIRGGVAYLAYLTQQFGGDLRLVAAAYYAGEQRIRKLGLACAAPEIYRYVLAVQRSYTARRMVTASSEPRLTKGMPQNP
jgi:soluble lytic murein transglycosylase-like protein